MYLPVGRNWDWKSAALPSAQLLRILLSNSRVYRHAGPNGREFVSLFAAFVSFCSVLSAFQRFSSFFVLPRWPQAERNPFQDFRL